LLIRNTTAFEFSASNAERNAPTRLSALANSSAAIGPFTSTSAVWAPTAAPTPSPKGARIMNNNANRYPNVSSLKKIPQRRLRRCSACKDITSFSIRRQSRPVSGGIDGFLPPNKPPLAPWASVSTGLSPHSDCLSESHSLIRIPYLQRPIVSAAPTPSGGLPLNSPLHGDHRPQAHRACAHPTPHRWRAYQYAGPSP